MKRLLLAATAAAAIMLTTTAEARRSYDYPGWGSPRYHFHQYNDAPHRKVVRKKKKKKVRYARRTRSHHQRAATHHSTRRVLGGQPPYCQAAVLHRRWCGCWLAHYLGIPKRDLWLASNWKYEGRPASPGGGVVVVWSHHVGIIRRVTGPGMAVVLSGNDGNAVRERERSIRGAIAFRVVGNAAKVANVTKAKTAPQPEPTREALAVAQEEPTTAPRKRKRTGAKKARRSRSSKTGRFVTAQYAKRHKATTQTETV